MHRTFSCFLKIPRFLKYMKEHSKFYYSDIHPDQTQSSAQVRFNVKPDLVDNEIGWSKSYLSKLEILLG